jgi:uncharacterized membrane protein YfcA
MALDLFALILMVTLGFVAAFVDSSFGMGYGMLTPILIILGFDSFIVVPVLLLSQMVAGFSGTIFHSIYGNVELDSSEKKDVKVTILFTFTGMAGMIFAVILAINLREWFIMLYIGIMIIIVGFIMFQKTQFKFAWWKLYFISGIASFNKAISGGGYGPIATSGQLLSGRAHNEAVAVTSFSEAFLSGFGFLLYFIFEGFRDIIFMFQLILIMVISGIIATPLGALLTKKLSEDKGEKTIAVISIVLGIITIIRFIFYLL